jgi:hypothetical protein
VFNIFSLDYNEMLGGLLIGWKNFLDRVSSQFLNIGIQIEVWSKKLGKFFSIINLY